MLWLPSLNDNDGNHNFIILWNFEDGDMIVDIYSLRGEEGIRYLRQAAQIARINGYSRMGRDQLVRSLEAVGIKTLEIIEDVEVIESESEEGDNVEEGRGNNMHDDIIEDNNFDDEETVVIKNIDDLRQFSIVDLRGWARDYGIDVKLHKEQIIQELWAALNCSVTTEDSEEVFEEGEQFSEFETVEGTDVSSEEEAGSGSESVDGPAKASFAPFVDLEDSELKDSEYSELVETDTDGVEEPSEGTREGTRCFDSLEPSESSEPVLEHSELAETDIGKSEGGKYYSDSLKSLERSGLEEALFSPSQYSEGDRLGGRKASLVSSGRGFLLTPQSVLQLSDNDIVDLAKELEIDVDFKSIDAIRSEVTGKVEEILRSGECDRFCYVVTKQHIANASMDQLVVWARQLGLKVGARTKRAYLQNALFDFLFFSKEDIIDEVISDECGPEHKPVSSDSERVASERLPLLSSPLEEALFIILLDLGSVSETELYIMASAWLRRKHLPKALVQLMHSVSSSGYRIVEDSFVVADSEPERYFRLEAVGNK